MSEKIAFIDLETTGTKFWKNGVHQISGIIDIDGRIEDHFDFKVQPNPQAIIEQEALKVAGVSRETIMAYPPMGDIYGELVAKLKKYIDKYNKADKFHFAGYNAGFDNSFLRAFFVQNGDKYFGSYFWSGTIDVMVLAYDLLKQDRPEMENFKLVTVAKYLGLEVEEKNLHDATYDVTLTREIYQFINSDKADFYRTKKAV